MHGTDQVQKVHDILQNHTGQELCPMCFDDVSVKYMKTACGRCDMRMCKSCQDGWYGQPKVGCKITESMCRCPYCKNYPKFDVIRKFEQSHFRGTRPTNAIPVPTYQWARDKVHAVCVACVEVKPAMETACADMGEHDIQRFKCTSCKVADLVSVDSKECPSCHVAVQKTGGCNHISCACGAHWCWSCQGEYPREEIYDHMAQCAGIF